MEITLILSLVKLGLEVFQGERKDKFLKKYIKIQGEYQDELNKGLDNRSDLKLDRLRLEAIGLAELVVRERNSSK
jgi:hypothetical protein